MIAPLRNFSSVQNISVTPLQFKVEWASIWSMYFLEKSKNKNVHKIMIEEMNATIPNQILYSLTLFYRFSQRMSVGSYASLKRRGKSSHVVFVESLSALNGPSSYSNIINAVTGSENSSKVHIDFAINLFSNIFAFSSSPSFKASPLFFNSFMRLLLLKENSI